VTPTRSDFNCLLVSSSPALNQSYPPGGDFDAGLLRTPVLKCGTKIKLTFYLSVVQDFRSMLISWI
jgi:hypothetical protein